MNSGRIRQKGTPAAPSLIIERQEHWVAPSTPGAGAFVGLPKGASREAWYAIENRRVVAVGTSKEELEALLAERSAATVAPRPVEQAAPAEPPPPPPSQAVERGARAEIQVTDPLDPRNRVERPRHFHNPYNFVPFVRRPTRDEIRAKGGPEDLLQDAFALTDGEPPGHHSWRPERWHGYVEVEMRMATPLLLPDPETERSPEDGDPQHRVVDVLLDEEGRPWIPPTALKGALRAAYECQTNSRLPRFDRHAQRLGFRRDVSTALELLGARVVRTTPNLELELYDRSSWIAALPMYPRTEFTTRYEDTGQEPAHGDPLWVKVEGARGRWRAAGIRKERPQGPPGNQWQPGYAYITGQNIDKKRNERIFFGRPRTLLVTDADHRARLIQGWKDLIADYRATHDEGDIHDRKGPNGQPARPDEYLGDAPGKTAWSAHLWQEAWQELKPGTLCYAQLSRGRGTEKVVGLYPVQVSRQLHDLAPRDLVPDDMLPATKRSEFSPADRVFGWVPEARGLQQAELPYRGHVRIGSVTCTSPDPVQRFADPEGLPLAILAQPKPAQARFYVARSDGSAQDDRLSDEQAGYRSGKVLRGRKVYPHHDGLPREHWAPERQAQRGLRNEVGHLHYGEFRRPSKGGEEQRDSQNRSTLGWVKAGSTFCLRVALDNLSTVEIGALLRLLDAEPGWHLRIGGGKPLGFGSAVLKVVGGELLTGAEHAARYHSLSAQGDMPPEELKSRIRKLKQRFREAVTHVYGDKPAHMVAYARAAKGHGDGLPVHYPRVGANGGASPPPHEDGESYRWFVANRKLANNGILHGYALDDLLDDQGLPLLRE